MNIELQYTSQAAQEAYEGTGGDTDLLGPAYGSARAAAFDLRAIIEQPMVILPGEQVKIKTGIKLNMGCINASLAEHIRIAAVILPRSGRGSKEGLVIANTVGLIDEDFQGEITLFAWARPTNGHLNIGNARIGGDPIQIEPGDRIGQLMFAYVPVFGFNVVKEFSHATERGEGGYGSTGVK